MNRQLSSSELDLLERSSPVEPVMTRREKLLRLAYIVRNNDAGHLYIFHNLEDMDDHLLSHQMHSQSAFAAAAKDPVLQNAGLAGEDCLSAKKFFELSTEQLHEFSCDCGGRISNEHMAQRIEALAA